MGPGERLWRGLRSRRLAITLITALAAYTALAALVPQGPAVDKKVAEWSRAHPAAEAVVSGVGFHHAFSQPVFIALIGLLLLATSACAVERTSRAIRIGRALRQPLPTETDSVKRHAITTLQIAGDADMRSVSPVVAAGLEGLGLKTCREGDVVSGYSGRLGLLGSPLFHWSLVALMLIVAAGLATRVMGVLPLPLDQRVADVKANYTELSEGPLFSGRYSGLEFVVSSLPRHFMVDGTDRGAVPYITAYRSGVKVAAGPVYPNRPLTVGTVTLHKVDIGPYVVLSLESTGGAEVARESFALERSDETSSGTKPVELALTRGPGEPPVLVRLQVMVFRGSSDASAPPDASRAILETASADARGFGPPVVVAEGSSLALPGGQRLLVANVSDWVRTSVINDWSVPFIYAVLSFGVMMLAVAVLVPTRRATVLVAEEGDRRLAYVNAWHSSRDPSFEQRVADAVRKAVECEEM